MNPRITRTSTDLHVAFTSDTAHIASLRSAVETISAEAGFDEKTAGEIGLVVNEAIANIIRHAYQSTPGKPIELHARLERGGITVSLRDWGSGTHPMPPGMAPRKPDPLTPGGLGLICMRSLMDEVLFTPQPRGMLLTMHRTKR